MNIRATSYAHKEGRSSDPTQHVFNPYRKYERGAPLPSREAEQWDEGRRECLHEASAIDAAKPMFLEVGAGALAYADRVGGESAPIADAKNPYEGISLLLAARWKEGRRAAIEAARTDAAALASLAAVLAAQGGLTLSDVELSPKDLSAALRAAAPVVDALREGGADAA